MTSEDDTKAKPDASNESGERREPRARSVLASAVRVVAGGAALTTAISLMSAFFAQRSLPIEGAQAVLVEWGATQLGANWSEGPSPSRALIARRVLEGLAIGVAAGGFVLAFAHVTRAITSASLLAPATSIALALLQSTVVAVRDELLLHGIVLGLLRGRPIALRLAVCAAASAAWAFGIAGGDAVSVSLLVVEALGGVAFGALWIAERGAWRACSAHAAWLLATRSVILTRSSGGAWGGDELLGGWAGAVALVPVCIALVLWARSKQETSAPPASVG